MIWSHTGKRRRTGSARSNSCPAMIGKVACLPQTSLDTRRGWPPKNPVRNANESLLDSEMTVEFRSPICHSPHWPPVAQGQPDRDRRNAPATNFQPVCHQPPEKMLRPTTDNARFESDSSFLRRSRSDSARLVGNSSFTGLGKVCSSTTQNYDVVAGLFEAYAAEGRKFSARPLLFLPSH